jgi:hypothetical protein
MEKRRRVILQLKVMNGFSYGRLYCGELAHGILRLEGGHLDMAAMGKISDQALNRTSTVQSVTCHFTELARYILYPKRNTNTERSISKIESLSFPIWYK